MTRAPEEPSELVYGVHPVQELLDRRLEQVDRLYVARDSALLGVGSIT